MTPPPGESVTTALRCMARLADGWTWSITNERWWNWTSKERATADEKALIGSAWASPSGRTDG